MTQDLDNEQMKKQMAIATWIGLVVIDGIIAVVALVILAFIYPFSEARGISFDIFLFGLGLIFLLGMISMLIPKRTVFGHKITINASLDEVWKNYTDLKVDEKIQKDCKIDIIDNTEGKEVWKIHLGDSSNGDIETNITLKTIEKRPKEYLKIGVIDSQDIMQACEAEKEALGVEEIKIDEVMKGTEIHEFEDLGDKTKVVSVMEVIENRDSLTRLIIKIFTLFINPVKHNAVKMKNYIESQV